MQVSIELHSLLHLRWKYHKINLSRKKIPRLHTIKRCQVWTLLGVWIQNKVSLGCMKSSGRCYMCCQTWNDQKETQSLWVWQCLITFYGLVVVVVTIWITFLTTNPNKSAIFIIKKPLYCSSAYLLLALALLWLVRSRVNELQHFIYIITFFMVYLLPVITNKICCF